MLSLYTTLSGVGIGLGGTNVWIKSSAAWQSFFVWAFSLLKALEFFVFRKMEMPETKNHRYAGGVKLLYKNPFPLQ